MSREPTATKSPAAATPASESRVARSVGRATRVAARYGGVPAPVQRKRGAATASTGEQRDGAMPDAVQAKMENAFGADFSDVRIHQGPQAASVGALAYTQGTDIYFQPGAYSPGTQHGQEILGHELTHVVQQSQGRVSTPTQAKGAPINNDEGLEREADQMGAAAARGEPTGANVSAAVTPASTAPIQRLQDDADINLDDMDLAAAVIRVCNQERANETDWQDVRRRARDTQSARDSDDRVRNLATSVGQVSFAKLDSHKPRLISLATAVREGRFRHQARALESRDDGHSLDRHGPEVTDPQLVRRLETGIAPDDVRSPAPGLSTKFVSYEVWLETRTAALVKLQSAIDATIAALDDVVDDYREKKQAFDQAGPGPHKAAGQPLHRAMTDAKEAVGDMVEVINSQVPNPDKAPARFHANKSEPKDLVTLKSSYTVLIEHGKKIGEGHRGTTQSTADPQLYTDTAPVASLTQSRTGIEPSNEAKLFDDAVDIVVDAWQVFQHFPAEEPATGIR